MCLPIAFRPLMRLRLATASKQEVGPTPHGALTIVPVVGGSFSGERLRGKVLPSGGDWVTAYSDGTLALDLRLTLETDDGALIHLTCTGVRDDANRYFRTVARFETAMPAYLFLNRLLAVGAEAIADDGPVHNFEEVL